jgi:hypothetical protein
MLSLTLQPISSLEVLRRWGLIDVATIKLSPTWRNKRVGDDRVSKRVDKFLILEEFANDLSNFQLGQFNAYNFKSENYFLVTSNRKLGLLSLNNFTLKL